MKRTSSMGSKKQDEKSSGDSQKEGENRRDERKITCDPTKLPGFELLTLKEKRVCRIC